LRGGYELEETIMLIQSTLGNGLRAAVLAAGLSVVAAPHGALAGDLSAQQIIDGLKVSKTRSLSEPAQPAMADSDLAFVKSVRGKTRSLSLGDRDHLAAIAAKRPKIDLDINFDFNSATVTSRAEPQLNNLGKALTSDDLAGSVVMLGGHTDGKGTDTYNRDLSERRAKAVKRFLMEKYHIPAANLISSGYGKEGYKNPADPFSPENRRVEIINMAAKEQATN
jgi:outer membrane protein OmpA-like peptidoglycan-associated protein